jgi:hypothetical protein
MEGKNITPHPRPFRVDKIQVFDRKPPKEDPNATIKNNATASAGTTGGDSFSQTATAAVLTAPKFNEYSD